MPILGIFASQTTGHLDLLTDYLVVAGGGGGASYRPAGGYAAGTSGSNSVFSTITSTGGGYGSQYNGSTTPGTNYPGGTGGSGGGTGGTNNTNAAGGTRTASPVQGNNGGVGFGGVHYGSGGGGGAGAAGGAGGSCVGVRAARCSPGRLSLRLQVRW